MNYVFSDKVSTLQASAIREILKFTADPTVISFAAGNPSPEAFPVEDIKRITAELLEKDPILALQYNITEGYLPLRNLLKERMTAAGNFKHGDDLIITSGAQQANELSAKVLCNEGDVIICEAPSFIGSLNSFKSYSVKLVGVELESDGINLEKLEQALKANPTTKLIYLIPNFQNPTGQVMSHAKRKAVYTLAVKYDTCILEDNPYGDLRFEGEDIPTIKSLDTDGRVLYTGTFSKVLAPGLRVGYISAPSQIIQKIVVCKQVADVHTAMLPQLICERFLTECDMTAHIEGLRAIYKHKSGLMLGELDKNFSKKVSFTRPSGGLFLWGKLPAGADMMGFCKRAVEEYKVAVVPGNAFMVEESDHTTAFRLNFSTPTDEQIVKGCELLGELSKKMFD